MKFSGLVPVLTEQFKNIAGLNDKLLLFPALFLHLLVAG
jgi:hypothetical protein